ncbi:MAG: AMP-binding protein [Acidimicrobiales bacterium]|nr:AMP-binding protein [Acidimicrobiales bacterium]
MEFNLADLFEAVVDAVPEREAIVDREMRLSYAALDERANRLAHALAAHGIGPGDHVGVWLYNGREYLETMLAAFKLRAVPINVNYRYVADELRYLFTDADIKAVVHEPDFAATLADIRSDVPLVGWAVARGDDYEAALASAPGGGARDFGPRSADDLYILYTGGTTGMPKGVMWRAEDIFFGALQGGNAGGAPIERPEQIADAARAGGGRTLPACPFMHGTAHWVAFWAFFAGGTVVISPDRKLDAGRLLQLIADEQVTFLVIVGDAFARPLVDALEAADASRARPDLSSLAGILSGGAILSPAVKDALIELLPSTIVIDGFGASETGGQGQMIATTGAADGRPRFRVTDETTVLADDGTPVEPGSGVVGRLARRGRIPLGYHKDPAKTEATFPVIDGVRWAVPGDMATIEADGTITLFGRGSVSINTGGEKVFPEEVEAALKSHPAVFDAIVVGVPDARWGERVIAVIAVRDGQVAPSIDELAEHAKLHVAGYKVPRGVVVVDNVVRSPSGKPDYRWAKATAAGE